MKRGYRKRRNELQNHHDDIFDKISKETMCWKGRTNEKDK